MVGHINDTELVRSGSVSCSWQNRESCSRVTVPSCTPSLTANIYIHVNLHTIFSDIVMGFNFGLKKIVLDSIKQMYARLTLISRIQKVLKHFSNLER